MLGGDDETIDFQPAGTQATGQYRCADCGYGVMIHSELPACPMCSGTWWEPVAWTPFRNARAQVGAGQAS
ncbi:MAG TPA: hypothetical protein VFB42_06725 [Gaiellaceae bacterium]|nr:hypothetical protein [Gaiellaceae bacterium]